MNTCATLHKSGIFSRKNFHWVWEGEGRRCVNGRWIRSLCIRTFHSSEAISPLHDSAHVFQWLVLFFDSLSACFWSMLNFKIKKVSMKSSYTDSLHLALTFLVWWDTKCCLSLQTVCMHTCAFESVFDSWWLPGWIPAVYLARFFSSQK